MKRKIIFGVICIICITFSSIFVIKSQKSIDKRVDIVDSIKEYYSIVLPDGFMIKESASNSAIDEIYMDDEKVATIQVNPNADYNLTISSIVENWIGMSAYIKEDVEERDFQTYQRYKALIGFEASAAQQEQGVSSADELHYFFVKDDLLLDLCIDINCLDEKNSEFIANEIELNQ